MSLTRSDVQTSTKDAVLSALKKQDSVSFLNGTGTGKTYALLQIIEALNPSSVLWLTNSEKLRDEDTPEEFIKWGYDWLLPRTEFVCYQTACRWSKLTHYYDLIIGDEFDFSMTDVYSTVYDNVPFTKRVLASASVREDQMDMVNKYAPIVYRFSTQDAQDAGIVNRTKFIFVHHMVGQKKDYTRVVGKKSWKTSEQETITYIENQYTSTIIAINADKRTLRSARQDIMGNVDTVALERRIEQNFRKLKWINQDRYKFLMTLDSTKRVAIKLRNRILGHNDTNKVITFTAFTDYLDSFNENTYHSKNKVGNTVLKQLSDGHIRSAGVCAAINRGANLVGVNHGILANFDGSDIKGQQRVGRFCRLLPTQEATIWILIPHYYKMIKGIRRSVPTRALGWSETMLSDFRIDEHTSKHINESDL